MLIVSTLLHLPISSSHIYIRITRYCPFTSIVRPSLGLDLETSVMVFFSASL
jgi:hypothetical protein